MSRIAQIRDLLQSIDKDDLWNTAPGKIEQCLELLKPDYNAGKSPIEDEEREIFGAFRWPTNICLLRSAMMGESVAVVAAVEKDETTQEIIVTPVFVMVTEKIMQELEKPS